MLAVSPFALSFPPRPSNAVGLAITDGRARQPLDTADEQATYVMCRFRPR